MHVYSSRAEQKQPKADFRDHTGISSARVDVLYSPGRTAPGPSRCGRNASATRARALWRALSRRDDKRAHVHDERDCSYIQYYTDGWRFVSVSIYALALCACEGGAKMGSTDARGDRVALLQRLFRKLLQRDSSSSSSSCSRAFSSPSTVDTSCENFIHPLGFLGYWNVYARLCGAFLSWWKIWH